MFISGHIMIQITAGAGSGSVNFNLQIMLALVSVRKCVVLVIDTVGCLCSIAVCLCFPLFHNAHKLYVFAVFFSVFETSRSGMLILTSE